MRGIGHIALVLFLALTALAPTGCGDELEALHRTVPQSTGDVQVDKWLDVADVEMSESGTVTVRGALMDDSLDATEAVVMGFSPKGRRVWGGQQIDLDGSDEITIDYRFGFGESNAEPTPLAGHYILMLSSAKGQQYVFLDFQAQEWVAD